MKMEVYCLKNTTIDMQTKFDCSYFSTLKQFMNFSHGKSNCTNSSIELVTILHMYMACQGGINFAPNYAVINFISFSIYNCIIKLTCIATYGNFR